MKRLAILALATFVASSAFAVDVWYNGDFNAQNGTFSVLGTSAFGQDIVAYDNFNWNTANNATYVRATTIASNPFSQVYWEIRTGMAVSNTGTLVASGFAAATNTNIGSAFGATLYSTTANIGSVALTNGGAYWLGIAVDNIGGPTGIYGIGWSSGVNAVGSPIGGADALVVIGGVASAAGAVDGMSMGIGYEVVPEPASIAALGLGALAPLRRRKKQA
jgi:hypothetical protein